MQGGERRCSWATSLHRGGLVDVAASACGHHRRHQGPRARACAAVRCRCVTVWHHQSASVLTLPPCARSNRRPPGHDMQPARSCGGGDGPGAAGGPGRRGAQGTRCRLRRVPPRRCGRLSGCGARCSGRLRPVGEQCREQCVPLRAVGGNQPGGHHRGGVLQPDRHAALLPRRNAADDGPGRRGALVQHAGRGVRPGSDRPVRCVRRHQGCSAAAGQEPAIGGWGCAGGGAQHQSRACVDGAHPGWAEHVRRPGAVVYQRPV